MASSRGSSTTAFNLSTPITQETPKNLAYDHTTSTQNLSNINDPNIPSQPSYLSQLHPDISPTRLEAAIKAAIANGTRNDVPLHLALSHLITSWKVQDFPPPPLGPRPADHDDLVLALLERDWGSVSEMSMSRTRVGSSVRSWVPDSRFWSYDDEGNKVFNGGVELGRSEEGDAEERGKDSCGGRERSVAAATSQNDLSPADHLEVSGDVEAGAQRESGGPGVVDEGKEKHPALELDGGKWDE